MEAPRFRALTYWHLAREADRGITPRSDVAAALGSTPEATGKEPGDLDAQFAFEILQRTQGRPPKVVRGWLARARAADRRVMQSPFSYDDPLLKRLTVEEREAVLPAGTKAGTPAPSPKPLPGAPEPAVRMVTRFPRRFAADLIAVSGCAVGPRDVAGALVKYGPDGRPSQVSIADSGLTDRCLEAGRALLMSTLAPLGDTTLSVFVVVPLAPDVLACDDEEAAGPDENASAPGEAGIERVSAGLQEPKKLVNVPPVYPEAARNAHVDGVVMLELIISRSGCVSDISVLRSVPLLDVAAMNAVVRWRYTPTLLNGRPVPVMMTVTVNFRLS
jgi:TonB family protein